MRSAGIFLIIAIIVIVAYSFFDYAAKNWSFPGFFQLTEKAGSTNGSASVSQAITKNQSQSQSQSQNRNSDNGSGSDSNSEETTDISLYFGKVKISGLQAKNSYSQGLITLSYNLQKGDQINVSGWRVKTRKGEIIVPQAIEKYQSWETPNDIIIENSGRIYLINGSNPLGQNKNFRLNKCFGYFLNYYSFYPSFYTYCSGKPELEEINNLTPYCQEIILRLSNCQIPDYSDDLKLTFDDECRTYLRENFNYNACFSKNSQDQDFLKNYWYLYTGRDIVEPLHDTVYLFDQSGRLVDKQVY